VEFPERGRKKQEAGPSTARVIPTLFKTKMPEELKGRKKEKKKKKKEERMFEEWAKIFPNRRKGEGRWPATVWGCAIRKKEKKEKKSLKKRMRSSLKFQVGERGERGRKGGGKKS